MTVSKLVTAVAKVAVATAFGGPFGGAHAAATQAVELISGWLGKDRVPTYESTLTKIQAGLELLAQAEHISDEHVEQALTAAQIVLLLHGLDAGEIVRLDLNAERASSQVLARARSELDDMDEAARELCRAAIRTVYSTMLAAPTALPDLQRAFQQAVLTRLTELRSQPNEILVSLKAALGRAAVDIPRLRWDPGEFSVNALLRPEFAIVPFYGRRDVLSELIGWAESDSRLSIRLYTGAGGMGKTRLMIQACNDLTADWRAGFLNHDIGRESWQFPIDAIFEGGQPLCVVVDYAETRASEVQTLVRRSLTGANDEPVRILLLARAIGDWWRALEVVGQGVGDILSGPATTELPLPPVARDPEQRRPLYESAVAAFRAVVPKAITPFGPVDLEPRHYDRVLYVLLKALAAVQGADVKGEQELLDFAKGREQQFLNQGIAAAGYSGLQGRPILQCAAVATLAGRAANRSEAVRLISGAPLIQGQPAAVVDSVVELLHRLYPGEAWLQGMQPDLLGEHLVEAALEEDPDLIEAAFGGVR